MLDLEFVKFENDWVIYNYIPEGKADLLGTIAVNRKTLERKLIKESKETFSSYKFKAFIRLEKFIKENECPQKEMIEWC